MTDGLREKLDTLNKRIEKLTAEHDKTLRELRLRCKHLRLHESDGYPPYRYCVDCGAVERGWGSGYKVLVTADDWRTDVPFSDERVFIPARRAKEELKKIIGPYYGVGQSHPNNEGGGPKTYEQLTEIPEVE